MKIYRINGSLDGLHVLKRESGSSNFAGPELNAGATGDGGFGVTDPETSEDKVEDK